jgi:Protein of unknown function (DUF1269)
MTISRRSVTGEPAGEHSGFSSGGMAADPRATTLTVWHYNTAMGASAGEVRLRDLEVRHALKVVDALTVWWMPGTPEPRVSHSRSPGTRARRGAVLGAISSRLRHTGVDQAFLDEVMSRLQPGTSALLVLAEDVDYDAVRPVLERGRSRGDVTLMKAVWPDAVPLEARELLDSLPAPPPGRTAVGEAP